MRLRILTLRSLRRLSVTDLVLITWRRLVVGLLTRRIRLSGRELLDWTLGIMHWRLLWSLAWRRRLIPVVGLIAHHLDPC
jgi:hypothetical protein